MAGDWIKFETSTLDKPEIWQLADKLDRTPEAIVGHLLRFWSWANRQSRDGNALVTDLSIIDRVGNLTGLGEAMLSTGWLVKDPGQVTRYSIPNWERHNGKSAKDRALTRDRVQAHRAKNGNGPVTETKQGSVTREEKRRENPPNPPQAQAAPRHPAGAPAQRRAPPIEGARPPAHSTAAAQAQIAENQASRERATPPPGNKLPSEFAREAITQAKPAPAPPPPEALPQDWRTDPSAIEAEGARLGMQRLPFEEDHDYAHRIEARIALG
jgi:hypothetical protein